ncbi:YcaO-like family protein [Streptomyces sp. NPDC018029]|uniref:YcaO-like family protein n=1 Tax=Streptomyces sp. NPDC018029 TaxID=3365032 RepID=UPI00379823BF
MPQPTAPSSPATWEPQVFAPFSVEPAVLFGRVAARSPLFAATDSAGGDHVLIGSASGEHPDDVAVRARGELLERLGNVLAARAAEKSPAVLADHTELVRRGAPALDPAPWSGPATRTVRQLWVTGRSLLSGSEVLVPAGLAFLQHRPPTGCAAPVRAGSTGLAAHPDRSTAVEHAAWETLERDLLRLSWQDPARHPPRHRPVHDELPLPLRRICEHLGLRATAFTLPAPGAHAVAVCLHTPEHGEQTFGARGGPAGQDAELIARAAYEALMVRWSMRTSAARRVRGRSLPGGTPVSAVEHAVWTYLGCQDAMARWLPHTTADRRPAGQELVDRRPTGQGPVDPVRLLAEHTGQDVIAVDTTPSSFAASGPAVVRLIAPGALPLPSVSPTGSRVPPHPFG